MCSPQYSFFGKYKQHTESCLIQVMLFLKLQSQNFAYEVQKINSNQDFVGQLCVTYNDTIHNVIAKSVGKKMQFSNTPKFTQIIDIINDISDILNHVLKCT